jgi:hypothetical protein
MHDDDLDVIQNRRIKADRRKSGDRRIAQKPFEGPNRRTGEDRRENTDRRSQR